MRAPRFWRRGPERPERHLTWHFFGAMFDFGILTPAGADSFVHLSLGAIGAFLALCLRFALGYAGKYMALSAARSPDPYRTALLGDDLFVIALVMLLIALMTLLVSRSLFPDERDFRILGPLPLRRIVIFRAKLAALLLFMGLFAAVLHLSLMPLMLATSISRFSEQTALARLVAWMIASVSASMFSVLTVAAVVGVLSLVLSRTRLYSLAAIIKSVVLALLVVCIPFVFRLPGLGPELSHRRAWLLAVPPAWFVGLQRVVLGTTDSWFQILAGLALTGLAAGALIVAAAYVLLFTHFEQLLLRPPSISPSWLLGNPAARRSTRPLDSSRRHLIESAAFRAVYRFTATTLRRSELHQGVLLGLTACGVALTTNRMVGAGWLHPAAVEAQRGALLRYLVVWTPFALMFMCGLSVRAAIALPMTHRANWIFRLTERDASRSEEMRAVERIALWCTVGLPVAAGLPVLWSVMGLQQAAIATPVIALVGAVFVHGVLLDWRRIPFTCSYLPGKRLIVYTVVGGGAAFVLFAAVGVRLVQASISHPLAGMGIAAALALLAWMLRRNRLAEWKQTPLMFDDELPDQPLQLGL